LLGQANLANALELLLEVAFRQDGATAFQALIVHRVALDGELLNDGRRPLAELQGAFGIHLVAHGDDGREVVVLGVVAFAVGSSYPKFSDNCFRLQLAVGKHFLQVVVDGAHIHVVELSHHFLRQPDVFVGVHGLHAALPGGRNERQVFRR
jgi:hypothetical protein